MDLQKLYYEAVDLLKDLIRTPSFSKEEAKTAKLIEDWFTRYNIPFLRHQNNIWAIQETQLPQSPILLLLSHHDTVIPNQGYSKDPFSPIVEDGKLYGLGSNDAGGCLVSLLATFTYLYHTSLPYTLLFAATAEEEINGTGGISSLLPLLPPLSAAIVGEPTQMRMAIAERGLLVIDMQIPGTASHAAHPNDDNPILKCGKLFKEVEKITFDRVSELLGAVKLTVTQIKGGEQHNVVPNQVDLVLDIRVNELYHLEEVLKHLKERLPFVKLQARSLRLQPSFIDENHPLIVTGMKLAIPTFGSQTLSDQALLNCSSVKIGPGNSLRSHTADEYVYLQEIKNGIKQYINLLQHLKLNI